jgi:hypothetical protein
MEHIFASYSRDFHLDGINAYYGLRKKCAKPKKE